jgi:hypothetical protein
VTWALVLVGSLAGFAAAMTALLWTGWWQPRTAVLLGAAVVAASCVVALLRSRRPPAPAGPAPLRPARWLRRAIATPAVAGHAAVLLAGALLWLVALAGTDLDTVGEYGLLASVHPAYLAALGLCLAGFLAAVARAGPGRRARAALPGAYAVLLILILHATTPLLLDQPQYAWTYKHLGVIDLVREAGRVVDPTDIYQQWPALFAAAAGLADLSGVAPVRLADWSAVAANLAGALILLAIARTLSRDARTGYLTVLVFLCVNWVEEDYLSPQAFAFLLSLGAILVALRGLRHRPWGPAWLAAGAAGGPDPGRRRLAVAALLPLVAVLTAAHQLSPYLVLAQLAALALLGLLRPWWTVPLLVAVTVGYLLPRLGLVSGAFSIFDGFNLFANGAGNADGWGSAGQAVSAATVRALALGVWALAALAVWRSRHRLGAVLVPAVLAGTPFVLLGMQSYGGEAIYRVFLFSAPWCAYLIAAMLARVRPPRGSAARLAVWCAAVLALAAATLGTVQGRHGQLMVDRQSTAEVTAARYLYAYAAPGATIALATPNFPGRITGGSGRFNRSVPVGEPDLVKGARLRDVHLNDAYLPAVERYLRSFGGTTAYLVISDGMRRQAAYFGYLPAGSLDTLDATLSDSPGWSLFYANDDVAIYQLR